MKGVAMKIFTILSILTVMVIATACSDNNDLKTQTAKQAVTESYASSIMIADIIGNWNVGTGVGKIERSDGMSLIITTEAGLKGAGKISGNRIEVDQWNVTGRLTVDKKKIIWDNTVVWTR